MMTEDMSRGTSSTNDRQGICPTVRWRDVGAEGVAKYLAPLLAKNRPLFMSGYWTHQVLDKEAAQRWKSFSGIKSILIGHGLDQLRVDVSCTKRGTTFRGDKANREQVSLKLMDMVEIAEAHELRKPHWAASEEIGLDFYLCQCPVVSREEGKPEVLSAIAGDFRMPSCVSEENLLQINLWMGAMETTTNMHYDANHNLLFVLKGSKRVALLPPNMTGGVSAMPVFSESLNHSRLQPVDTARVMVTDEAMQKGAVYAHVAEGEALFIPEGWWHQVTSSSGTVAANVWFKGARPALCEGPSSRHMREYYLRCLVQSLLADRLGEASTEGDRGRRDKATISDIEVAAVSGKKRAKSEGTATASSASPLCSPSSTTEERNLYLRTTGTGGMMEELPRIARERPAEWARLVTGLDPVTAHVITTQWESAGGAASMPEFYAAIFGTCETATRSDSDGDLRAAGGRVVADKMTEGSGTAGVGFTGGEIGSGQRADTVADQVDTNEAAVDRVALFSGQVGVIEETAAAATRSTTGLGGDGPNRDATVVTPLPQHSHQQQQQQQHRDLLNDVDGSDGGVRPKDSVSGVALQERLSRLREAFAKEQLCCVLKDVTGW